ncbi:MAG: hypothetical protein WBQ18_19680 [Solirubrobacteraceae bacterium]|jgi:hypothetical protein
MSSIFRHSRLLITAVCCLALGAGVSAIASAGAATSGSAHAHAKGAQAKGLRRFARRAVHGDVVVATKNGFATVVFDRGTVQSVNGQQLTIKEGTKKATYKTVTLTIPAGAKVRDNRQAATLSDLKAGQRVLVLQGPKRTLVAAHTLRNG